ncbi:MAG: nucleoside triphosphate pyrophosphatase [Pseudomonadota bacterium]|nr:nucleoside triphosphate pyrophosphatase [Pseudomonadota bacterium]
MTLFTPAVPLILASRSRWRRALLVAAGLEAEITPSGVDEDAVKEQFSMDAPDTDLPMTLAELKARQVATDHPEALVLGADQILTCDGKRFDKPADAAAATAHLRAFSGRTHSLVTAAVIMHQGQRIWHVVERAHLTMRPLTEAYIEGYLAAELPDILETVGAYRLEGRGVQLFEKIDGNYFTILGLPMLPLLAFLRQRGDLAG